MEKYPKLRHSYITWLGNVVFIILSSHVAAQRRSLSSLYRLSRYTRDERSAQGITSE